MRLLLATLLFGTQLIAANVDVNSNCSLSNSMSPECYHARDKSFLNIALLYYGDFWGIKDINRIGKILKKRFQKATSQKIKLNILIKEVIPFKHSLPDDYKNNGITDKKRLQRLWYYDNLGAGVMKEIYNEFKLKNSENDVDQLDAILAITGAQFNGLGFANGRISVTEQPQEVAWANDDQGRTDIVSDYRIVDELIHELGHNMFLGHAVPQCQKRGMSYKERVACCAKSENKNDVLSYCRNRKKVSKDFMHGFEACNQSMINRLVIPAMLAGGDWKIKGRKACR